MRKFLTYSVAALVTGSGLSVVSIDDAAASPSFARANSATCSTCHDPWPLLNAAGRAYKENGYKFSAGEAPESIVSDFLKFDEDFPISAIVKARPYDKKESGDEKIRALHEFEIVIAGQLFDNVSVFFELEAEDEDNFEPKMLGRMTWHASKAANVQLSYGEYFVASGYNTLSGKRRTGRDRNSVIEQKFGGADNGSKLRDPRQTISIYGRPTEKLFYTVGVAGPGKDPEGQNPGTFFGRVAFDVMPDLMIGGFAIIGECEATAANCSLDRDYKRFGVDFEGSWENFRVMGAWMTAEDDVIFGEGEIMSVDNSAMYIQGMYIHRKDGRPLFVPSVRFDRYEKSAGTQDFTEVNFNLSYYPIENLRIYAEWWKQIDAPTGVEKNGRVTLQIEAGF